MDYEYETLKELFDELDSSAIKLFDSLNCQECSLPLKDYGCDLFLFGEDNFTDLIFCGKCAADYSGEEDYHSEISKDDFGTIAESNEIENLSNIFPLLA